MRATRITAWTDATLDLAVVGFAARTVAYHECLVTRVSNGCRTGRGPGAATANRAIGRSCALRVLDVDIACVYAGQHADRRRLARAGYRPRATGAPSPAPRASAS